jgi:two-component system osmolarity sensor histidine kinase EnvZ
MEACDLNELISSVVAPYIQQGHSIRLCLETMPSLALRRVSIKRMLVNLLENALRYGEQGIEVAASVIQDEQQAAHVAISVLDRGAGLDPADLQRIFNPFFRGDQARGGQGAGLGLAIVQRIAAQHGGKVELHNRAGGGLDATVCLPITAHEQS